MRLLLLVQLLVQIASCRLTSLGIDYDRDAKDNGFIVYTSKVSLPEVTTTLYREPGTLFALAKQAYSEMMDSCKKNGFTTDCPGAISVFAFEKELHFASSTKDYQQNAGRRNYTFYYAYLRGVNMNHPASKRKDTVERVKEAMIKCQTQISRERNPSLLDESQHKTGARCGEFTAISTYLFTKSNPRAVTFVADSGRARIMTVGRQSGSSNLDAEPFYLAPCQAKMNERAHYGCTQWINKFGIWAPSRPARAIDAPNEMGTVERVELCDGFMMDDDIDSDDMDEMHSTR